MAKFCPNCGNPVRETAAFCVNCGNKLEPTPAPLRQHPKHLLLLLNLL